MSFASSTVFNLIADLNENYFLPSIQRPYVWEPEQILSLFDSLMKGYPIGSFLFWKLPKDTQKTLEIDIYEFIRHFKFGDTLNQKANVNGKDTILALDGQQRLTSLLIGLKGSYKIKLKNKRWNNPKAFVQKTLHLNLLQKAKLEEEDDLGISYGFSFYEEENVPSTSEKELWFNVSNIMQYVDKERKEGLIKELSNKLPKTTTIEALGTLQANISELWDVIHKNDPISYFIEHTSSYDRVLNIFVRANSGGTVLNKSDLLLSTITSRWANINARDEIYYFVDRLNKDLNKKNNLDKDFVMRACLVLSDLEHVYKVENFTRKNISTIESNWEKIKYSLEATIKLINSFGIDRDTLTSSNALLPIAYYLYKIEPKSIEESTEFAHKNSIKIKNWLIGVLLNGIFGGSSDQTIGLSRQTITESLKKDNNFPINELAKSYLIQRKREMTFSGENIESLLDIRYGHRTCFLALSLLYDEKSWGVQSFHIDHIIPKASFSKTKLQALGKNEEEIEKIQSLGNSIGNLQLLLDSENSAKKDTEFYEWVITRDNDFCNKHHIPQNKDLWSSAQLMDFVKEREKLITNHINIQYT